MLATPVQSLGWEDPLEKEMATHSSIFAWRIPWTEEPHGLRSMGWQRVRHNCVTNTSPQTTSLFDFSTRDDFPVSPQESRVLSCGHPGCECGSHVPVNLLVHP